MCPQCSLDFPRGHSPVQMVVFRGLAGIRWHLPSMSPAPARRTSLTAPTEQQIPSLSRLLPKRGKQLPRHISYSTAECYFLPAMPSDFTKNKQTHTEGPVRCSRSPIFSKATWKAIGKLGCLEDGDWWMAFPWGCAFNGDTGTLALSYSLFRFLVSMK